MSTLVQHTYVRSVGAVDSIAVAFASSLTAGNTIVAPVISNYDGIVASEVTDTRSHTYVRDVVIAKGAGSFKAAAIMRVSTITGGACTVTYNGPGTDWLILNISEWSGMAAAPLSGTGTGEGNSAAPVSASFGPTGPCTVIGMLAHDNVTTGITEGATYTLLDEAEDRVASFPFGSEYKLVGAGTYTADWTLGISSEWSCVAAAYLDASAVESAGRPGGVRAGW
jgi:hypothetical protein